MKIIVDGQEREINLGSFLNQEATLVYKERTYYLNGDVVDTSNVYDLSLGLAMWVVKNILDELKISYSYIENGSDKMISVNHASKSFFEKIVTETFSIRLSKSATRGSFTIIRQLPRKVLMEESNRLVSMNKEHAIYSSARGGYNIKVRDYANSALDYYCYTDSKVWD